MTRRQRGLTRDLLAPTGVALAILAAAPPLGTLRDWLIAAIPGGFVPLLAAGFVGTVAAVLGLALRSIRRRGPRGGRGPRLAALGLALGLAAALLTAFGTGEAMVDAVERAHLLAYGLLTVLLARALGPFGRVPALILAALASALVAVLDEWLQWLVPLRVGEARDILLNVGSTLPGVFWALAVLDWPPPRADAPRLARRAATATLAALLLAAAGFLDCAHLGHRIEDPEIGSFLSYFSPEDLPRIRAARERRWRQRPPVPPSPWGREDYFLTEAAWRVAHRNAALEARDLSTAWRENRILERHYGPVLDARSFRSGEPHRWPEWLRAQVERQRPAVAGASYSSPVLSHRIWTSPSPTQLWSVAALGSLALLLVGWSVRRSDPLPAGPERPSGGGVAGGDEVP